MSFVPNVLLRRLYKKGSLRRLEDGIAFDLKNILGPGIITKINFIEINDNSFDSEKIIIRSNEKDHKAHLISVESPLFITFQQQGTLIMKGDNCLVNGKNKITLELVTREAGKICVSLIDNIMLPE